MKKLFAYIFLPLFLYGAVGYFPAFLFKQNLLRKEIKQRIKKSFPENELSVFSFNKTEYSKLKWEKENKEFHYENSMYDIVKKLTDENGNIILYCINDKQENQLFAHLEEMVQKNSSNDKTPLKIFKLLSNIVVSQKINFAFVPEKEKNSYSEFQSFFSSFIGKIPAPPPKLV